MLEVTVKVWGNHVVRSEKKEKESLQWEAFAEKGFKWHQLIVAVHVTRSDQTTTV